MITTGCEQSGSKTIELSMIVDGSGTPRNIAFLHPAGGDLDKLALRIAESDRFKPGDRDGAPVAVAQSDELNLDGCAIRVTDRPGHITTQMWLSGPPKQRFQPYKNAPSEVALASASQSAGTPDHVATGISAPVALTAPVAEYSDEAREARYQGECMISVVVDAHGMPQNPRVVRPLGKGLDERALEAVMKYRFRPAVKNGMPVAVMVTIAVNFRL
jgi:TonB family protein